MGSRTLTGAISTPRASFTRPAETDIYAAGDLVEEINVRGVSDLYGLIEARGTYTPASGEEFTVDLEMVQA